MASTCSLIIPDVRWEVMIKLNHVLLIYNIFLIFAKLTKTRYYGLIELGVRRCLRLMTLSNNREYFGRGQGFQISNFVGHQVQC